MDARLAIDSTILLLYFALIIAVGLYMGRKEENLKDFALGGRRMPWWAVLASLIAAETTAATYFGAPRRRIHVPQLHLSATRARHYPRAHSRQLHFHQAILRLQSLLHLRIPYCPLWRANEKRRVRGLYHYAIACLRRALVFRRHRTGSRL